MKGTLLLINGPNLNMLGSREKDIYGSATLVDIEDRFGKKASDLGYKVLGFQSNDEGEIVDFIQKEGRDSAGLILNAGALTHTSIAIRDALLAVRIPFIEVHLSNVFARESFRHKSFLSDIAIGVITGFGENSYYLGLTALVDFIDKKK